MSPLSMRSVEKFFILLNTHAHFIANHTKVPPPPPIISGIFEMMFDVSTVHIDAKGISIQGQ